MDRRPTLIRRLTPPERFRRGPLRECAFAKRLHDERTASIIGVALGIAVLFLFVTGVLSRLIQDEPFWFQWPSRPVNLYRITQGIHVAVGIAAIPLLLAKLYVVYPKLFRWPPIESIAHLVERISLLPLVGSMMFMFFTGVMNVAGWEPWGFFFPRAHFWGAWVASGSLVVHVGAKGTAIRRGLSRSSPDRLEEPGEGLGRRGFLATIGAASAALTIATLGQTVRPLRWISVLGARDPATGPQGFPVNKSARSAGVLTTARDPSYRLRVEGNVEQPLTLSLGELRELPSRQASLPIACVQGWSADARWRGVPVRDLLDRAGASANAEVEVESIQSAGQYRASMLNRWQARDEDTLLAYEVNGEALHIDHGFPVRLIGPNRPGVMQTKWVARLVVR